MVISIFPLVALHSFGYALLCYLVYDNIWTATWQNHQTECAPSDDSDQPGHPPSLISLRCALSGLLRAQGFFMRTVKTLIRLGGCPGWSVFAGRTLILLVLSCRGSFFIWSTGTCTTCMYNRKSQITYGIMIFNKFLFQCVILKRYPNGRSEWQLIIVLFSKAKSALGLGLIRFLLTLVANSYCGRPQATASVVVMLITHQFWN